MRIVLGRDFDGGSWPGALSAGDAAIGVSWVGPLGFVGLLETALGLTGLYPDDTERAAELAATISATPGFWSRSASRDLLGSAARLVSWRDELWESGFRGAPTGQSRLDALAAVTFGVSPGLPDRLDAIRLALATQDPGIDTVELADPEDAFPLAWRRVLDALRARGVSIVDRDVPTTTATGDLAASSRAPFHPVGDHTLQLLRPGSTADAAEHVAAWIAALDPDTSVVVIGSDLQLDRALARFGVPMLGASTPATQNPLLAVLPLVLELGWAVPDPAARSRTAGTATQPGRRRRRVATRRRPRPWPAVDSDRWREIPRTRPRHALRMPTDRRMVADRIARIFSASAQRGSSYPVAAILERASLVDDWLAGSEASQPSRSRRRPGRPDGKSRSFVSSQPRSITTSPGNRNSERLLSLATAAAGETASSDAQAGISAVSRPGAIVGPVDHVVWWNFTQSSVRQHRPMFLSHAERAALASAGVELPDPGAEARRRAPHDGGVRSNRRAARCCSCARARARTATRSSPIPRGTRSSPAFPKDARPGIAALEVATPRSARDIPTSDVPAEGPPRARASRARPSRPDPSPRVRIAVESRAACRLQLRTCRAVRGPHFVGTCGTRSEGRLTAPARQPRPRAAQSRAYVQRIPRTGRRRHDEPSRWPSSSIARRRGSRRCCTFLAPIAAGSRFAT